MVMGNDKSAGVSVFMCGGRSPRPECSTSGCTGRAVATCDYALTGKASGRTCDRRLCASCRHPQPPSRADGVPLVASAVDYCPPHDAMVRDAKRDAEGVLP